MTASGATTQRRAVAAGDLAGRISLGLPVDA